MNLQEFKVQLFTAAKAAGLEEFELYCKRGAALTIKVFNAEIDEYKNSDSFGASFRGKVNGKMGYAFSEKIDESVVGFLVKSVQENAAIIEDDDEEFIYGGDPSYPEVKTYNPALNDVGVTGIVDAAFALEKAGLEYDPRAQSMPFCMVGSSDSEILIANSKGLDVSTKNNAVFAVANVLVNDNGDVKTTYEMVSGLDFDKLDTKKLGEDAAKKSLANLGAIQPKSGKYPAILDPFAMGLMLSTWADSFSAEAAHKGFSLLAGKVGEDIAASCVTLVDDPLMPEKYASTPFDSEGVASRTK
ncbi:MAG: TldD/PmbA family protein, partial [Defluviitaleaceae bacterium]|nr:TldD/PmbA family protein [Defluviitaleaceae bacterium]